MKGKIALTATVAFAAIAVLAVVKFDRFSLALSDGRLKAELRGETAAHRDNAKVDAEPPVPRHPVQQSDKAVGMTAGDRSPIVTNTSGTSVIVYGSK